MKTKQESRIFSSIMKGGFAHTIAMLTIWYVGIFGETMYPMKAFVWYVVAPTGLYCMAIIIGKCILDFGRKFRLDHERSEKIMAFFYVALCCSNYIFLRKFDMAFLELVLPFVLILLERRSKRSFSHVVILIIFYEFTQLLPDKLPNEPTTPIPYIANLIFGIYISVCIMVLMRETKDTYTISFKEKEESEVRVNAYREFIIKKHREVREAVHNVKGTAEMLLRYNVSDISAGKVVTVMDSCDRITEKVDRILESSRVELFKKDMEYPQETVEDVRAEEKSDGTYLHSPNAYILVADDSVEALNLIRVLLARTGIRIDTVVTGDEAVKLISYNFYNMILVDHMLPDMSAVSLKRAIDEGYNVNAQTPVLVFTSDDQKEIRDFYINEGFADIIPKPFSGERIERTIEKYLPSRLVNRVSIEQNQGGSR